jgi:hypothetical protein
MVDKARGDQRGEDRKPSSAAGWTVAISVTLPE